MTVRFSRIVIASIFSVLLGIALPNAAMSQTLRERIAFQRNGTAMIPGNVVVMFADNTTSNITAVDLADSTVCDYPRITPALSPDGHLLSFAAKPKGGTYDKLFTWALDDQNNAIDQPVRLTLQEEDVNERFPAWSPDGQRLAYLAIDQDNKKASLRIINKDGSEMKVLQESITYFSTPSWSPAGDKLLFINNVAGKPTLISTAPDGGITVNIRPTSKITAACYSSDGTHIAALLTDAKGQSELWSLPPSGHGGIQLAEKITGCSSVNWLPSGTIVINAVKIGNKGDNNAFWFFDPATKQVTKGVTAYVASKAVGYFSARSSAITAASPAPLSPNVPPGPDTTNNAPTQRAPSGGAITILSPNDAASVRGVVTVKMSALNNVASLVVRIDNQFAYAATVEQSEDALAQVTYNWDTQALIALDPTRGDINEQWAYKQLLRYPDGDYTLVVNAFDKDNKPVGTDSIKVTVKNLLPDSALPADLVLQYKLQDPAPEERYLIHGEGNIFGAYTNYADSLDVSLNALVRRDLVEVNPNNSFSFRTYLDSLRDAKYPLETPIEDSTIPEEKASALYLQTETGDLSVMSQRRMRVFLPLSEINVPLPLESQGGVHVGDPWSHRMYIVTDLLARESTPVIAQLSIDGAEWINNRQTVRIRADYHLNAEAGPVKLPIAPADATPGMHQNVLPASATMPAPANRGLGNPLTGALNGTLNALAAPAGNGSIDVQDAVGVRYAWFDYEQHKIVRVEDFILYNFQVPYTAPPALPAPRPHPKPQPAATPGATPGSPNTPGAAPGSPNTPAADEGDQLPPGTLRIMLNGQQLTAHPSRPGFMEVDGMGEIPMQQFLRLAEGGNGPARRMPPPRAATPTPSAAPTPAGMPGNGAQAETQKMVTARYLVRLTYLYQPEPTE